MNNPAAKRTGYQRKKKTGFESRRKRRGIYPKRLKKALKKTLTPLAFII
jgi:hypothetical protein